MLIFRSDISNAKIQRTQKTPPAKNADDVCVKKPMLYYG